MDNGNPNSDVSAATSLKREIRRTNWQRRFNLVQSDCKRTTLHVCTIILSSYYTIQ